MQKAAHAADAEPFEYQEWNWWNEGFYKPGERNDDWSPRGLGLRAIKTELAWLGYDDPPMKDNGYFGTNMGPNVKRFQNDHGLIPDGVIGPRTALAICHKRIANFEEPPEGGGVWIPDHLLCRQLALESAFYFSARNTTMDFGLAQLHIIGDPRRITYPATDRPIVPPGVSEHDAWLYVYRVGVNVRYLAESLREAHHELYGIRPEGASEMDVWYAVVFSHNAPGIAPAWLKDGLPETGGGDLSGWFAEFSGCSTWAPVSDYRSLQS